MKEKLFSTPRNFGSLPFPYSDLATSKVVILPVPYESTVGFRHGTSQGPRAIIDASVELELYDHELDKESFRVGIHTLPEVEPVMASPEKMIDRVYELVGDVLDYDKIPVMLGGEHSLTVGAVKAAIERIDNLSVLQLDAHADLRDQYLGTKLSNACVMRRIVELCPVVQVGIRSLSQEENEFIKQRGMTLHYADNFNVQESIHQVVSSLSNDVYITIDLDVFDPSVMPAVGTPEPGGLGWYEVLALLKEVSKTKNVVGFDVVELCPIEGPVACSFMAAKLAYKIIGYST